MKCPACQFENTEQAKFCSECGCRMQSICPECGYTASPGAKFCNACGCRIATGPAPAPVAETPPPGNEACLEQGRKHVTVLFSDLSGYTAMSETMDPEEVREIMGRIYGEVVQIVVKYEGHIDKFIGDAAMVLFGVPKAHEDDPVRAILTAHEIHEVVKNLGPSLCRRLSKPLSMHTGINTGVVVTGEINLEQGIHGVLGDTINVASRLCGLAREDEIVVGHETWLQSEGHFHFEKLEPARVKGKEDALQVYRFLTPKEAPTKTHRLSGLRAELIGRRVEMARLQEALANLRQGKGSVFSVVGDAGTGKSRLIEDFKATIDPEKVQWREGHAYAYSQNMPYYPLIDLLSRAWQIQEGDSPEQVRKKAEAGAGLLLSDRSDLVPYLGSLYSITYPEIENVSPEFWKTRLQEAVQEILSAMARRMPVVICLEDLHWADPSSIELIRLILKDLRLPALFLCAYRPSFSLFTAHQLAGLGGMYQEIRLQDLSSSEAQSMVESLLKSDRIPSELQRFIQTRVEGNPFYLEEVVNALIESGTLVLDDEGWKLTRPMHEANIPSTIQGVIAARLDGLERDMKRVIQEASVIGRSFLYEILKRVSALKEAIDKSLSGLERLELIRTRSVQPDLEYIFKHAITQEVVYNGLLKKERQELHERIGRIMEQAFQDRLPEFYETLAFHYTQGQSTSKAVDYLIKCGEKSLNRYSLDEAHRYFQEAFDTLKSKENRSREDDQRLIGMFFKWFLVYYYHGDFKGLTELLLSHKDLAESLDDKGTLGRFYACLGFALNNRLRCRESHDYLKQALLLGEETDDKQLIAYAACWMSWTCSGVNKMDEGITFGQKALELARLFPEDQYLHFKSLSGMAWNYGFIGEGKKAYAIANELLEYGRRHSNIRCITMGYASMAASGMATGDFQLTIQSGQMGVKVSLDNFYKYGLYTWEALGYAMTGQLAEAQRILGEAAAYFHEYGIELFEVSANTFLGACYIAQGQMSRGLAMIEEAKDLAEENGVKLCVIMAYSVLGRIYKQMAEGSVSLSPAMAAKNIGFLMKHVPFAAKKAESHYQKAIGLAREIGTRTLQGQAKIDLGLLYKLKGRTGEARQCLSDAVRLFEECEADVFLKEAREELAAF